MTRLHSPSAPPMITAPAQNILRRIFNRPLRGLIFVALSGLLASCGPTPQSAPTPTRTIATPAENMTPEQRLFTSRQNFERDGAVAIAQSKTRKIAVLLPFTAEDPAVERLAVELFRVLEMGLFDLARNDLVLVLHDTQGTASGAETAMRAAIRDDVDVVIGPLFSSSVAAIGPLAQRAQIPVLALSNDRDVAQAGVWVLGLLPEQALEQMIIYATAHAHTRFAVLLPQTPYGARLEAQIEPLLAQYGGQLVELQTYPSNAEAMFEPVQKLAHYAYRKSAHEQEYNRILAEGRALVPDAGSNEALKKQLALIAPHLANRLDELARVETIGEIPYDAVIIPDGGLNLRNVAPLLPYFDIDPKLIKFMGSPLWFDQTLTKEPPLRGAWFPTPHPEGWAFLAEKYEALYGARPARMTSLAYDALSVVAAVSLADAQKMDPELITSPAGFIGIDGLFRLTPAGLNERSFAIMEIGSKKFKTLAAAPRQFADIISQRNIARARAVELARPPDISWRGGARP